MTDAEKIANLLLDSAWKGLGFVQERIDKMEDKANKIVAFSGVLMTIDIALIKESKDSVYISIILLIEIILLIKCVWHGYCTVKVRTQKVLSIAETFKTIDLTDHVQSTGDLSITIANIQQELVDLMKNKSLDLEKSMKWFTLSLGFLIIVSLVFVFFPQAHLILTLLQRLNLNP
ncbi:Uncharacterised protein [uncultured archaeon]|nr:Uncharacterised protein [uncultured archaeon]